MIRSDVEPGIRKVAFRGIVVKRFVAALVATVAAMSGGVALAGSATGADAAPMPAPWLKSETTLIGHKGAISKGTRNTLTAMRGAFALGAHGIEFDVVPTKDNHPVVLSDTDLSVSTLNCTGHTTQYTYNEVRKCLTLDGQRIPNVYEAIMVARDNRGQAWVHVKSKKNTKLAQRIVAAVNKYGMNRKGMVTVFGWHTPMQDEFKRLGVARVGLIFNNTETRRWDAAGYVALIAYNTPLPLEKVRAAQARGVEVVAVESFPLSAVGAIALGVDAVIMDDFASVSGA